MKYLGNVDLLDIELYTQLRSNKRGFLLEEMLDLFNHHIENCSKFRSMMRSEGFLNHETKSLEEFPFLPVRLFKILKMVSVREEDIVKTMSSSGTSGQAVSKIYLDKHTALLQTKILSKIVSSFIGNSRIPMIILDCESTVKNRNNFSARAAGITGFSIFATKRFFALNENMTLNVSGLQQFVEENKTKTILLFGFTYIVYKHFYNEMRRLNCYIDLSNGILIHGGGWKKLTEEAVNNSTLKNLLFSVCGVTRVHDYYGMVEQTGTIYMECEYGYLHTSEYSDIIIRNPKNFAVSQKGENGLIQLLSIVPWSYPGHSVLTEDVGVIIGEDDCTCGRKGKYFQVLGRLKNAEIRGCSDTFS